MTKIYPAVMTVFYSITAGYNFIIGVVAVNDIIMLSGHLLFSNGGGNEIYNGTASSREMVCYRAVGTGASQKGQRKWCSPVWPCMDDS